MPTLSATAARDTVAPALQKAQGAVTTTVVPAVVTGLGVAKAKGTELLDSDLTTEVRRRGSAIVKAAKGETLVTPSASRWRFGLGMVAAGTGLGFAIAWLVRKLTTPVDSYTSGTSTMPVPSGTDGGNVTTPVAGDATAAPSGTPTNEINLSAGAPTSF
jgi:hypothetical protein